MGHVLALLFDSLHADRHIHREQARRLNLATDDVEDHLILDRKGEQQRIGRTLELRYHDRTTRIEGNHDRLATHQLPGVEYEFHIVLVCCLDGLAAIRTVGEVLLGVATSNTGLAGVGGSIVIVLQADGHIAIASFVAIGHIVTSTRRRLIDEHQGKVGILRIIDHVVILLHEVEADGIVPLVLARRTKEAHRLDKVALGDIDVLLLGHGKRLLVVLQHDHRLLLNVITGLHILGATNNGSRFGGIEIGILEQTYAEDIEQKAISRLLETLVGALLAILVNPHLIGFEHRTLVVLSAKLIDTRLKNHKVTFGHGHILYTPAHATETLDSIVVEHDVPVGASHTVEMILLAKLLGNHPLTVAAAHIFTQRALVPENAVDRHHSRSHARAIVQLERTFGKRLQMLLEIIAWIDGILAITEVRVTTALLCTITIPMLHHRIDRLITPGTFDRLVGRRGLESVAIGAGHIGGKVGIIAESAAETAPTGIGGDVDLWREGRGNAQGTILAGSNLTKPFHRSRVESGGNAQRRGP